MEIAQLYYPIYLYSHYGEENLQINNSIFYNNAPSINYSSDPILINNSIYYNIGDKNISSNSSNNKSFTPTSPVNNIFILSTIENAKSPVLRTA